MLTRSLGLSFIKDMFFFHEHARKIGLWAWLYLLSPYLGKFHSNRTLFSASVLPSVRSPEKVPLFSNSCKVCCLLFRITFKLHITNRYLLVPLLHAFCRLHGEAALSCRDSVSGAAVWDMMLTSCV